jgi:hypothetical protein
MYHTTTQTKKGKLQTMTKTNHYLTALAVLVTLAALSALSMAVAPSNADAATRAKTTLTIKAEGVDLSGTVESQRLSCLDERKVRVYKQVGAQQSPKTDPVIASDISERQGNIGVWSTGNTGLAGKFYARTGGTLECTGATSKTIIARR